MLYCFQLLFSVLNWHFGTKRSHYLPLELQYYHQNYANTDPRQ